MNRKTEDSLSRRDLMRGAALAGGAWAASELLAVRPALAQSGESLKKRARILFQGDSITDAGRNRRHGGPNNAGAFGRGYPFLIASYLLGELLQASIRAGEIKKAPTGDIKITPLGIGNMRVLKDFVDRKDDVEGPEPALAS